MIGCYEYLFCQSSFKDELRFVLFVFLFLQSKTYERTVKFLESDDTHMAKTLVEPVGERKKEICCISRDLNMPLIERWSVHF